ncbi:hypothetical protein FSP39_022686 [Pinctada imbricata]|uniref:NADH dehydrogenase [ubiquinone] 1 beta subcomplex subunit 9 n=1 Tax=Pinctada imbricata TaxID=66713 RepID=A0AA88XK71_PINIB|nr:hypothetical protein FSP39_022686 [Pinctada imbricata]
MASKVAAKLGAGVVATTPQSFPKYAIKSAGDHLTTEYISHGQRVTRLYKRMIRSIVDASQGAPVTRFVYPNYLEQRLHMMKIRKEFDDNKDLDEVAATAKLEEAEELGKKMRSYKPFKYPFSPGGSCYARVPNRPDMIGQQMWLKRALIGLYILDISSATTSQNFMKPYKAYRKQVLKLVFQLCVFHPDWSTSIAAKYFLADTFSKSSLQTLRRI